MTDVDFPTDTGGMECPECNGTGFCPGCGGDGCPRCDGDGDCQGCKGDGEVAA